MAEGKVGDRVLVESGKVGLPVREGQIREVLSSGSAIHYRVRWEDGHESTGFPEAGSLTIIHMAPKARPRPPARRSRA